jgi:hypothetical protein
MLWDLNCPPETELIESTWSNYVSAQKIDWISEAISQLTANQRAVDTAKLTFQRMNFFVNYFILISE